MKDNNNAKYRIIIEGENRDVGLIYITPTSSVNKYNETKFEYSGYWLDDSVSEIESREHEFKGFVESWIAHPVLFVLYKILFKEMNQWINEAKWDY